MAIKKRRIVLITLAAFFVLLVFFIRWTARMPSGSVLELTIAGQIAEEDWPDLSAEIFEGRVRVFRDLLEAVDRASRDDRIAGISLEVHSALHFGKAQELRHKLQQFTVAGKFCTAYLEEGNNLRYYLATACPEVYLTPTSTLNLNGLLGHATFYRGLLDKIGVYPDLQHIAEYKAARNIYTEKQFTSAHREMTTSLLEGWQQQLIEGIAEGRKLETPVVEKLLREGPFLAKETVEKKLVDKLLYYDEYRDLLKQKAQTGKLNTVSVSRYLDSSSSSSGPRIALVHATGLIVPGESGYTPATGRLMGSTTVAAALRAAREDDAIRAIILRVDSPGGAPVASEIIRREVQLAKAEKPVVVSMSDVAGSGGYWIAMSADKIVADPGTLTGSIGVVYGKMNIKGLYNLLGLTTDYVALAPNATYFYEFENYTPAQRRTLEKLMGDVYQNFLAGVAEGRGLTVEQVAEIAKGRVWLGSQALELGLVDELGGLETAVALAKNLADIPAGQAVELRLFPRPKTAWQKYMDWIGVRSQSQVSAKAWLDLRRLPFFHNPVSVLMPFSLEPR